MGLDMYLYAEKYTSKYTEPELNAKLRGLCPEVPSCGNLDWANVRFEVAYWRKANQIHKWFVDNVQDGKDECQESYLSAEKLQELLDLCREVKRTKNADKLPPESGFFFGSTDIDEWYWQDIDSTIKQLEEALKLKGYEFIYRASW